MRKIKCLIVGTDKLGTAPRILKEKFGATEIVHWSGREKIPSRLPSGTGLAVVYSGFVNHGHAQAVKRMAKNANVRLVFVNRGLSELAV